MTATVTRRTMLASGAGLTMAGTRIAGASEPDRHVWRMITSWPRNLPGPGITAQRLADRITTMSAGRLTIQVYGAGELVPALGVLDGVQQGVAEIGHTASFFWTGKMPAAAFFTTVPFGLTPEEHMAWLEHGGGQALWDRLYAPFGVKPFAAGNSGMQMGGWFLREIRSLADLKGLKMRIPGLAGRVMARLGVTPVLIPPSEIFAALQSGAIDATEFLGPWSDRSAGFHHAARYYYWPGFHEPNGTGEAIVALSAWRRLPPDLQAIVENACRSENAFAVAETEWHNAEALEALVADGVLLRSWPTDVLKAARRESEAVLSEFAAQGGIDAEILQSYQAMRTRSHAWSRYSRQAFLTARHAT